MKRPIPDIFLAAILIAHPLAASAEAPAPFEFSDHRIMPGSKERLKLHAHCDFTDSTLSAPVFIVHGMNPGPTLTLVAGIHGDELNGVEIARRIFRRSSATDLHGTLVILPIVNLHGFLSGSRYMHDRRDLNRAFPGDPNGSTASIIAFEVFNEVIRHSDAVIDLHCASNRRTNLPHIRADFKNEKSLRMACKFGIGVVLDGEGPEGSLRRAALEAGVPAIVYEAGAPLRFEEDEISRGITGVTRVMYHLKMLTGDHPEVPDSLVFHETQWVRAPHSAGGSFLAQARVGQAVEAKQVLGRIVDPLTGDQSLIHSPRSGTIIGMTVPTLVFPGEALFHLGLDHHPEGQE